MKSTEKSFDVKTPVIVPAFNEGRSIGRLLDALMTLPEGAVDVVVASNGSTDNTVSIAESYSKRTLRSKQSGLEIDVLDIPEQGLVPATQQAIEHIGERALNPFLYVYADSVPVHPEKWLDVMYRATEPSGDRPVVVSGPVSFTPRDENDKVSPIVRSLYRIADSTISSLVGAKETGENGGQYGPNMAFHIHDEAALQRVLSFNIDPETGKRRDVWPMSDVALTSEVVYEGDGVFKQIHRPSALMLTPESISYPSLLFPVHYGLTHGLNFWKGLSEMNNATLEAYRKRAAPGAIDFDYKTKSLL